MAGQSNSFATKQDRALRRVEALADKALAQSGGNPDKAEFLLWQWGRQDRFLREDIFRAGCAIVISTQSLEQEAGIV